MSQSIKQKAEAFANSIDTVSYNSHYLAQLSYRAGAEENKVEWVSVKDRLPTKEMYSEDELYFEVLTLQTGRNKPSFMKYWELKNCPFTTHWMIIPSLSITNDLKTEA